MRREVYNGVIGLLPPCAEVLPRRPKGAIIAMPDCSAFTIIRNTAHYVSFDAPLQLRKLFGDTLALHRDVGVLPPQCHQCSRSKYVPCMHINSTISESISGSDISYSVNCNNCGLLISGLPTNQNLQLLQPTRRRKIPTALGFFREFHRRKYVM